MENDKQRQKLFNKKYCDRCKRQKGKSYNGYELFFGYNFLENKAYCEDCIFGRR